MSPLLERTYHCSVCHILPYFHTMLEGEYSTHLQRFVYNRSKFSNIYSSSSFCFSSNAHNALLKSRGRCMYAFSGKMHRRNFNGIRREPFQWNFLHTMPILFKTLLWYSSLKFEKGKYFPYTFVHKVFCIEFCTGHRRGTGTYQCTLVKCFCKRGRARASNLNS